MTNLHRLLSLPLLLVGGLGLALSASATDEDTGLKEGMAVPRFTLPVVNGDVFTEAKKWGPNKWVGGDAKSPKKLIIMSFFATWCEPCKKEMPELARLYREYGDQGLGVMLVSIDERSEREALIQFAAEQEVPFPVVHDAFKVVARRYKFPGRLPYMLMVGPDGNVKAAHIGYTEAFKDELEPEVRGYLGLSAKKATAKASGSTPTASADADDEKSDADKDDDVSSKKGKGKTKGNKGKKKPKKDDS